MLGVQSDAKINLGYYVLDLVSNSNVCGKYLSIS